MAPTILIIDDDADTRTYMSTILLRGGFRVRMASDGDEGWRMIQEERPDLILLDMMMPRKSGLQVLRQIKTGSPGQGVPVIVITGVGQMTGVDFYQYLAGQEGGAEIRPDEFIEKPVKPDRLLKAVRSYLNR
jgi:CheY-like chemotaxis protein